MKFAARAQKGGLVFPSDYQRDQFRKYVKENDGIRLQIEPIVPDSNNQRAFYHGAIIPLWAYLDGKDHRDSNVLDQMHQVAKLEFNGGVIVVNNVSHKVAQSTKGKLNQGFIERVMDYLAENYGIDPSVVLNPELYKRFRDEIYPYSNYEDFIAYMRDIKLLK